MKDAYDNELNINDRVWTFDINGDRIEGVLKENTEYPHVSSHYVSWDDGEDCAVLDFNYIFKVV